MDSTKKMDTLLTAQGLADYLEVPRATVYAWRHRQKGPPGFRVGRHLRFRLSDVEHWINKNPRAWCQTLLIRHDVDMYQEAMSECGSADELRRLYTPVLTTAHVAKMMHCTTGDVRRKIHSGELKALRWGRQFRFFRDEVLTAMIPVQPDQSAPGSTDQDEL